MTESRTAPAPAPRVTETEHGRVWPGIDGDGFVACPTDSCADCPSVGATLCGAMGESRVYLTREAAAEALAEHAEHGCRFAEAAEYAHLVHGTRVRHTNGDLGTVVGDIAVEDGEVLVTVAFDEDETERRHPSTVTPVA